MTIMNIPKPLQRQFLPKNFKVTTWNTLQPYFNELLKRPIYTLLDLEQWILDWNELQMVIRNEYGWRYIYVSGDSQNDTYLKALQYLTQQIFPKIAPFSDQLNHKLVNSPWITDLDKKRYAIYLRGIQNALKLYRVKNIPLFAELQSETKKFGRIVSEMTIEHNGQEITLQQANLLLAETNRDLRATIYQKIIQRRYKDYKVLDVLFDDLVQKRHQIAVNADFENYRDYKFSELERFDYTPKDCFQFHEAILQEIVPLVEVIDKNRKKTLGVANLFPYDLFVDPKHRPPLRPFQKHSDLIDKSIRCLEQLDPFFGECLATMAAMKHLDLETRKGKRPGGYNMTLPETGVPFVFMNSANSIADMRTIMHEAGHAVHSFLTRSYKLVVSKSPPSEVAELAAMSMELLTMDYWDTFFEDASDLRRAKIWQLSNVLRLLPWIATIDKFQHWLYTHPTHNHTERDEAWMQIYRQFSSKIVDRQGFEKYDKKYWQRQIHLFEMPFYYIEYGIAQLGAIAIWRQYRQNPQQALVNYKAALSLGYTATIGEIYEMAGIRFDFSQAYIKELASFVKAELEGLL